MMENIVFKPKKPCTKTIVTAVIALPAFVAAIWIATR